MLPSPGGAKLDLANEGSIHQSFAVYELKPEGKALSVSQVSGAVSVTVFITVALQVFGTHANVDSVEAGF